MPNKREYRPNSSLEFKPCADTTLGIEIEFQLLEPFTLDLTDGIAPLLDSYPDTLGIKPELTQCTVEINSKVCADIRELESDVLARVKALKQRCESLGMALCSAGTHPFCRRPVGITCQPRYLAIEKNMAYLSRRLRTFALHVHVGMPSGDTALAVMALLKPYLPLLLALSASSPFWEGVDTECASFRQRFLAIMRDYGVPPNFNTWNDFAEFFENTRTAGLSAICRDLHWDLRPSPAFGTLEVRVMDALPTVRENVRMAALVYTLIIYLLRCREQHTCGYLPPQHWWMEKMNHYNASCQGLEAAYIYDDQGHNRPLKTVIQETFHTLAPIALELGTADHLQALENHLVCQPSYLRQRRLFQQTGCLRTLVATLIKDLEEDLSIQSI
ncbi:MAG: carboxylate-amine ligase [Gammaproteobacteria bacterium]